MAITHANFLTQVRNYTEVDSNVLSDTILDQFIRNVELEIAGQVDYDDLRKYANSNFTAGNRAVSMPYVAKSCHWLPKVAICCHLLPKDV